MTEGRGAGEELAEVLRTTKYGTVGWLAKQWFTAGWEGVQGPLAELLGHDATRDYFIVRPGDASQAIRLDMPKDDTSIGYDDFSPHPLWGVPYTVLSVQVKPEQKDYFMFHGGEEILVPVEGRINYRFFWTEGGTPPRVQNVQVGPPAAIRINPQIPHHAWAMDNCPAQAWMIMRHASDSPAALSSRARAGRPPRIIVADALRNPTQYALVAWGLAEGIRIARERAEVGVRELAAACNIQPAQISRLESIHENANVSMDVLGRVAAYLRVPLPDLIRHAGWASDRANLSGGTGRPNRPRSVFAGGAEHPHRLHVHHLRLSGGGRITPVPMAGDAASWIVLSGRITVEIVTSTGMRPEVVDAGSVIHFRNMLPSCVEARDDAEVLQITHAIVCNCEPGP